MSTMRALSSPLRKQLESAVLAARRASEGASRAAIEGLGVFGDRRPDHLDADQAALRNGLRAKWRQFGNDRALLVAECAYEQWHRLLFARFLAENRLLLHPQYKASVTLADCEELASELGEPDGWSVAARFASEILPGIFRLDDPCVQLRLAPEGRHALEQILDGIPAEVFRADDALGWVYQFWQKEKKDEVNASERKIGGADLGPATQLFTENYMVRFLLENSLGAWWAARHPDSALVKELEYLRFDDGGPAAGSFDGWPDRVAEVTVMDPCCGSGHFLVEAFSMLWQMRVEEEDLTSVEAQDAVLRDNLFGLELDPRCVQIAMFAIALQAWKAGGGWRPLLVPNIACSGIPVKAPVDEWKALAGGDERVQSALVRLHILFRDADTLGSLIDPRRDAGSVRAAAQRSLLEAEWHELSELVTRAASRDGSGDVAAGVLGMQLEGLSRAISLLASEFTLVATNVPFLSRSKQDSTLRTYLDHSCPLSKSDLATSMFEMWATRSRTVALVTPQNWQEKPGYTSFRDFVLRYWTYAIFARVGNNVWQTQSSRQPFKVPTVLSVISTRPPELDHRIAAIEIGNGPVRNKAGLLRTSPVIPVSQRTQVRNPDSRIVTADLGDDPPLELHAAAKQGIKTGDDLRYRRFFWEVDRNNQDWAFLQSSVVEIELYGGRSSALLWEGGNGALASSPGARVQGQEAWDADGVLVSQMGDLHATLYTGELFDSNAAAVVPFDSSDLPALWAFLSSPDYRRAVRAIDNNVAVTNRTLAKVPFDVERWRQAAKEQFPEGLPRPWSDDPTQWLFEGRPKVSSSQLQVAVARLVGYRWPEQPDSDGLDVFADRDGIVCLPSVAGEAPAADRVQQVLAAAFGDAWSPATVKGLLVQAGTKKNLADWLQDEFFKQHCALFGNRPFVWHIWDGQRDGFSALVNYHRLDRKMLEKLTYTYLGTDWVERQRAGVRDEVAGAEARLSAALELQGKLEKILEGAAPYDVFVRWKEIHEQPIGWEPDLNDGVRLNIRPFVEAGVLRTKFNIHWKKDRGKNPDGSERHNDIHLTLAEKHQARQKAGQA